MKTDTPDGGPAFPFTPTDKSGQIGPSDCGMTLRDYFAAAALQGWLASYGPEDRHPVYSDRQNKVACNAYALADAMLAARKDAAK